MALAATAALVVVASAHPAQAGAPAQRPVGLGNWISVPTGGAAVGSDDDYVFVYDAAMRRMYYISKHQFNGDTPMTSIVDLTKVK